MTENAASVDFVIGLGETGKPLKEVLQQTYTVEGRDIEPVQVESRIEVLHICIPFQVGDFVATVANYIKEYQPDLTIIHSTVVPGTTRQIYEQVGGGLLAFSPIRGKHTRMRQELLHYTKFVAGVTPDAAEKAATHLAGAGLMVQIVTTTEALEAAKLIETTYLGLLISWAQEIERYSRELNVNYDELLSLTKEVKYLPQVAFQPGFIGGHCIIPNIHLLEKVRHSPLLRAILESNEQKKEQYLSEGRDINERIAPKPWNS